MRCDGHLVVKEQQEMYLKCRMENSRETLHLKRIRRWENNIEVDCMKLWCEDKNCMELFRIREIVNFPIVD
jgi:hypothetical protein